MDMSTLAHTTEGTFQMMWQLTMLTRKAILLTSIGHLLEESHDSHRYSTTPDVCGATQQHYALRSHYVWYAASSDGVSSAGLQIPSCT